MGLRNLAFPTIEVQTSGGPLAVRGLSLDHILGVFYRHREDVTALYSAALERGRSPLPVAADDITVIAIKLISNAPVIVGELIALASGSHPLGEDFPGDVGIAMHLSVAEQIDALEKIAGQTFTSDMPPGKIFALLLQGIQAGVGAVKNSLPAQTD